MHLVTLSWRNGRLALQRSLGEWGARIALALLFIGSAFIFALPAFQHFDNWGIQDWDQHLFYHAVPAESILDYGQFPLWNPYHLGGAALLANPQSVCLSPAFLIVLLFGPVHGLKIEIWLHLAIGMAGAYWLARHHRLARVAAILSASVFMLSSMFILNLTAGMTTLLTVAYIPWMIGCYLKAYEDLRYGFLAGLACALMYFGGGVNPVVIAMTFVCLHAAALALLQRVRPIEALRVVGIVVACSVGLGAIKILPSIEFMAQHPRRLDDYSGYSLGSLLYSLLGRDQTIASILGLPLGRPGFRNGFSYFLDENGMYIGIVPLTLCMIGIATNRRRLAPLIVCLAIFVWLSFGDRIPISLWDALHKLPVYDSMRAAQRFRYVYLLLIGLFAGFGLQAVQDWIARLADAGAGLLRLRSSPLCAASPWDRMPVLFHDSKHPALGAGLAAFLTLGVLVDLVIVNSPILSDAFPIPAQEVARSPQFHQASGFPSYASAKEFAGTIASSDSGYEARLKAYYRETVYRSEGALYPAFLANVGTIDAYEPVPVTRYALPSDDPGYRGEVYLKGTAGQADFDTWTPNRLVINLQVVSEGYVVVNQNYDSGWRVSGKDRRRVESINGLLGVRVSAGDRQVELRYLPGSFVVGTVVSAVSLLLGASFIVRSRRAHLAVKVPFCANLSL